MQGTRDLWGQWNLGTGRLDEPERDGEGERLMKVVKVVFGVRKIGKDSGLVGGRRGILVGMRRGNRQGRGRRS